VEFEMDLHNRFSTLADAPQQLPDPETEWARLKEAAQQAAATENTCAEVNKLLNYVATYPSDGTTY
jgi:hypothetical protein